MLHGYQSSIQKLRSFTSYNALVIFDTSILILRTLNEKDFCMQILHSVLFRSDFETQRFALLPWMMRKKFLLITTAAAFGVAISDDDDDDVYRGFTALIQMRLKAEKGRFFFIWLLWVHNSHWFTSFRHKSRSESF